MKEKTEKKSFLANTSWLLIGNVLRMVFQFAVNILIARYLGPERQGVINYVATYTAFFSSLVGLGLNGVIIYELVNSGETGKVLGSATGLRMIVSFISILSMLLVLYLTDGNDKTILWIALLQAVQLPFSALDTIKYWYQRNLQSKYAVLLTTVGYAVSCLYKIWIIVTKKSVIWFGFCTTLDIIMIGCLYLLSFRILGKERLSFDRKVAGRLLKACIPFALANIMIFIYSKIDTIMIRHMLQSMTMVGFYTTAVAICGYVSFVPTAILDSARPLVMSAKNEDEELYGTRMRQSALAVAAVGVLYAAFILLLGRWVIRLLYGQAYLGALGSLRIAVWYTAFAFLGSVKSIWLICEKKNRYVILFAVMGAATNVVLNALMIPKWGIEGAAVATLLTQICTHVLYPALFPQTRGFVVMTLQALTFQNVHLRGMIEGLKKRKTGKTA